MTATVSSTKSSRTDAGRIRPTEVRPAPAQALVAGIGR